MRRPHEVCLIMKKFALFLLTAALLASATACGGSDAEDSEETFLRQTFPEETYSEVEDAGLACRDSLLISDYPTDSPVGQWLASCASPDRDDHFDAYVLRHETTVGADTTFTFLVYYPHGGAPLAVTPELLDLLHGYMLNLHYDTGSGAEGYSLCRLSMTLDHEQSRRFRLSLKDGEESLGVLTTVTETPIP